MTFDEFNRLSAVELKPLLKTVCHCDDWVEQLAMLHPFSHVAELLQEADRLWLASSDEQVLESIRGHSRIGDLQAMRDKFSVTHKEQGQVQLADPQVIESLWQGNRDYEEKFGFMFIVFASGKSAQTMLDILLARLLRSREEEIQQARLEQSYIAENRLRKLFVME